ncbi:MAG: radical SAM protein [Polyangiaceae bacterium]|nr:radical SAM protein [Polyangiaceae bacterium]
MANGGCVHCLLDRFRRNESGSWGSPPDHPQGRWGGHLKGVIAALPYLRDLGVNVLHLSPVALSPSSSSHRYDAVDPQVVDPELGGEEGLQKLIEQAHSLNLRVLLDVAITHTDRDFAPFVDVRRHGYTSRYAGWFTLHRFPFGDGINPGYEHYQKGQWREPLLRTDNPEVVEYLGETFARWARLGIDGFRVDAAADVPISTLRRIASAARAAQPDLVLFGEVVPPNIHRYTADAFDSATDFTVLETLLEWLHKKTISAQKVAETLSQRRFDRGGPAWSAIQFTTTHDHHRFLSVTGDMRSAQLAQLFVLLAAPVPMLLYGDEVGLTGGPAFAEMEGAWSDRLPMSWPTAGQATASEWNIDILEMVKRALHLRRNTPALTFGDDVYFSLETRGGSNSNDVLVMRRTHGDQMVDILLNGSGEDREVTLPTGGPTGANILFQLGAVHVILPEQTVRLPPYSAAVLERVPTSSSIETVRTLVANSPAIVGAAFRNGYTESAPYPTHLYLTVTERCNIQCEHCITFAPEKTADGRARTVEPWLLDALREPFSALEYIAFVHGGESLVAPIFWDVLKAVTTSRSRRPGRADIHLLSNGMLLNETRVRKLIDHGLTSLSVSIDGASQATNDTLRKGGKLEVILSNLKRAAEIRREMGVDLRMGVSTVVTLGNYTELPSLGRLVVDLGLDWLKVEEIFPCTKTARSLMIPGRDPRIEEMMGALCREVSKSGLVVVDHRDPPSGCACEGRSNALLAEFRKADNFANRANLKPCRMEWEQAAIDPDGTVHPVDYGRPAIGNLLTTTMAEIWNGPEVAELRKAALRRTSKQLRRQCPF